MIRFQNNKYRSIHFIRGNYGIKILTNALLESLIHTRFPVEISRNKNNEKRSQIEKMQQMSL